MSKNTRSRKKIISRTSSDVGPDAIGQTADDRQDWTIDWTSAAQTLDVHGDRMFYIFGVRFDVSVCVSDLRPSRNRLNTQVWIPIGLCRLTTCPPTASQPTSDDLLPTRRPVISSGTVATLKVVDKRLYI